MNELITTQDEWKDLLITDENVTVQGFTVKAAPQLTLEIGFYLNQTAQNIIEVGKRLIVMKSFVKHGQWQQWLEKNFQLKERSAQNFMQCAERYGKTQTFADLGYSQMIALLSLPDAEETEKFIEQKAAEGKRVAEMTIKELREEIADYKKAMSLAVKEHQQNLFNWQEKVDDLTEQLDGKKNELADAQKELKERPKVKVEPDDYQSTKTKLADAEKELLDTKVALELSKTDAQKQAEAFAKEKEKMQADFDKSDKKKNKKIKKLTERLEAKDEVAAQKVDDAPPPTLFVDNGINFVPDEPYKLLLTDPPYSTDVDDIKSFAESWLPNALRHVRRDGFAYVFIGAYPDELCAYLNITPPEHLKLIQILVWTYRNTLGNNPKDRYKQNWQACLFYRGVDAPALDCPITNEQWAVQDINAPDGRLGNRRHTWQKPDEIAERFIRHSTQKGDIVFDPFACTGTFLLAAAGLGRKAYGFEINPDNAAIAFDRGCTNGGNI